MHASNQQALQHRYALQRQLGVEIEVLSPAGIQSWSHLCTDDVLGGIYGYRDGYLNPRGALQGFVERSRELGCIWLQDDVTGFTPQTNQGAAVHTRANGMITTPTLIITTGAWTQRLAALAGIDLPVVPVRRQACYVTLPNCPRRNCP